MIHSLAWFGSSLRAVDPDECVGAGALRIRRFVDGRPPIADSLGHAITAAGHVDRSLRRPVARAGHRRVALPAAGRTLAASSMSTARTMRAMRVMIDCLLNAVARDHRLPANARRKVVAD